MTDMLFWVVNLSSFENFVRKKKLGSNGLIAVRVGSIVWKSAGRGLNGATPKIDENIIQTVQQGKKPRCK